LYVVIVSFLNKELAPACNKNQDHKSQIQKYLKAFKAIIPPIALIVAVLGSIFSGIATPTESASIGAVGAVLLAILYKRLNINMIKQTSKETIKISAMVFAILIGATAFSMVFTYTGGDTLIEEFILGLPAKELSFIILSMLLILILGFFIDFIEISFIIVPILYPIALTLNIDMAWFAILIAMNLQTSFLTPPFGFSLFYLKGVAPSSIATTDIYKGVIPFIIIQTLILVSIVIFPSWYGFG
jgi:tripartite ATP-independent transporter DctM subunit